MQSKSALVGGIHWEYQSPYNGYILRDSFLERHTWSWLKHHDPSGPLAENVRLSQSVGSPFFYNKFWG